MLKRVLLVYKKPRPQELKLHEASFGAVQTVLRRYGITWIVCDRECLSTQFPEDALIITIGGDGTFLEASHYAQKQVMLGVNSNTQYSVGSLCAADSESFEGVLKAYLEGQLKSFSVVRIQAELEGKILPFLALNDVLIAHRNPASMTRYDMIWGSQKVFHKNSGLWVSTACGSTGAVVSTGGSVQPMGDKQLQWVVREPYFDRLPIPELLRGFVAPGEVLEIISHMDEMTLFMDGPHVRESFSEGQCLRLSALPDSLNILLTPEMEIRRQKIGKVRKIYESDKNAEGGTRTRTGVPGRF